MFSWLKNHFIPHEGNSHRPHLLRGHGTRNVVLLVLFLEIFAFFIPVLSRINITGNMAAVLPAVLDDLTNQERQAQNLQTLTVSPILNEAAQMKAEDMATKGYFAHTSPDGKTPWYWLEKVGYQYQYAGENLAINFIDSKDVTNAWMNSPTHKANIVKGNYTDIGSGVATGMYEGKETIFVVQLYANPLPQASESANFTTVQGTSEVTSSKESTNVLGVEAVNLPIQNSIQTPTFWQKLLASPRNTTSIVLDIIFGIVALALLLYVFIKVKNQQKDLIARGLIALFVIVVIFIFNYYWSYRNMTIMQSLDYSSASK